MSLFTRRTFLKTTAAAGAVTALGKVGAAGKPAAAKPNVLMLCADDLNDWIGCLGGHPQVKTPNLDRLAARGTLFANNHCQAPLCTPSRNSLLTGLRPSTTGSYGLKPGIRQIARTKDHVTLPQTFTRDGYHSVTCGKVYHEGTIPPAAQAAEFKVWAPIPNVQQPPQPIAHLPEPRNPLMDWGQVSLRDEDQGDYRIATQAIDAIGAAPSDKPFFIACGFRHPHVPCLASQKWFDLYPEADLVMPPVKADERKGTPRFSWYLHWKLPEPRLKMLQETNEWRPLVRAYLASISFVDAQVGRVLDALDASGRADDTVIVFWSDHGYHLGEKEISGKNTLWERATHVPLMFVGPGIARGATCTRPVESLDIFPTLLELAGFPERPDLEGHSLAALCRDATAPRPWPAITTHNQNNHSVRTEQWRYIRYADGSDELYDMIADPHEWTNLAGRTEHSSVKQELAGWLPRINVPPTPGSQYRILTYDQGTKLATWWAPPIGPREPIPEDMTRS